MCGLRVFPGSDLPWHPLQEDPQPWERRGDSWVMLDPPELAVWARPNPALDETWDILLYALTVNGYSLAREVLGRDCGDVARDVGQRRRETGVWSGTLAELRCRLFMAQRAAHWDDGSCRGPEANRDLVALNLAICDAWAREWPAGRPQWPWTGSRPPGLGDL